MFTAISSRLGEPGASATGVLRSLTLPARRSSLPDHAARRGQAVQAHEVGLLEHLVEVVAALDAEGLLVAGRLIGIVDDNAQPERFGPQRRRGANAPAADDAERPPAQPRRPEIPARLPPAGDD